MIRQGSIPPAPMPAEVRALPIAVATVDRLGQALDWNREAARMLGWPLTQAWAEDERPRLGSAGARWYRRLYERASEHGRSEARVRVRVPSGQRALHVCARLAPGQNDSLLLCLADETRHFGLLRAARHMRDRLRDRELTGNGPSASERADEQLRQTQKLESIGRLAGGIAHEFNNLLTAIQGHAQFLVEDLPANSESHADALEIKWAALRASAVTRQLLMFSRRTVLNPRALDLNGVVTYVHRLLTRVMPESVLLRLDLESDLWPIYADPGQMEIVVMNLVVNARDAIAEIGTVTIATRNLRPAADNSGNGSDGRMVELTVSDNGAGMDEETRSKIFEPFFTTKAEGKGTGLGLATVSGIISESKGEIRVESETGVGTAFHVRFPAAVHATTESGALEDMGPGVLLLVDAEDQRREATAVALRRCGFEVVEAESATAAIAHIENPDRAIDLVITEIVLPSMSGRRLKEVACQARPGQLVMYLSDVPRREAISQGLVDPDTELIEKPFIPDRLASRIRDALDTAKREAAPS